MFDINDCLPCAQCNSMVEMHDLNDAGICPDCAYENAMIDQVLENEPEWLKKTPARWGSSTFFSS